jgi:flagellar motor switch protein FliG
MMPQVLADPQAREWYKLVKEKDADAWRLIEDEEPATPAAILLKAGVAKLLAWYRRERDGKLQV